MQSNSDILAAFRRSERAMAEQIAEWESLEFGVAFSSSRFPLLPEANQLRDVWLAEVDGPTAFERADLYYRQRGLKCRMWTPASGQDFQPVESILLAKGWKRVERPILALTDWNAATAPANDAVRILPARAMRKAYWATFDESSEKGRQAAEAAIERLNDPDVDAFVAMLDGKSAGRISYLSVGDIARLADLSVISDFKSENVGGALAHYALQLARRMSPKVVVTSGIDGEQFIQGFAPRATDLSFVAD